MGSSKPGLRMGTTKAAVILNIKAGSYDQYVPYLKIDGVNVVLGASDGINTGSGVGAFEFKVHIMKAVG